MALSKNSVNPYEKPYPPNTNRAPTIIMNNHMHISNGTVTLRNRDTMDQVTLKIEEVVPFIEKTLKF